MLGSAPSSPLPIHPTASIPGLRWLGPAKGPRPTVFVGDDDPALLEAIRWIVADEGYRPMVHHGPVGLASRVASVRPDLVLIEVGMAGLAGKELDELLRIRYGVRPLPLVFHSRGHEPFLRRLVREHGALGFIPKGEPAALRRRLRVFLELD